jgi:hypothetical protein
MEGSLRDIPFHNGVVKAFLHRWQRHLAVQDKIGMALGWEYVLAVTGDTLFLYCHRMNSKEC